MRLFLCRRVHVSLHQNLGIVEARCVIVRGQIEHPLEQELRIIEHVALDADAREQPHCLDLVAVFDQEGRAPSCSAAARSPSENSAVAVTTSGGSFFSVATCAAAKAAFSACPVIR